MVADLGADGVVRVYRGDDLVAIIRGRGKPIEQVAFVGGGRGVLTSDSSGTDQIIWIDTLAGREIRFLPE